MSIEFGLTDEDRADLHARLASWFGDEGQAFLVSHLAPVVDRIKSEACARAVAEVQWNALEMARKAEQEQRRAESAEAEAERLRSRLAKVRRVFDLQCPPLLPSKYDSQGAWMAHTWWDRVLGAVLREADTCEWCGRPDGHENGCRLGLGPDEHSPECACLPPYANCSHPPCGCSDCVRGHCEHDWLDRPESDTTVCDLCGEER